MVNFYTKEEVVKHNTKESFWVYRKKYVYDITELIKHHPGDFEMFKKKIGIDVSRDYNFHNKSTKKKWKEYFIGYLK